jgi:hypothetical protein
MKNNTRLLARLRAACRRQQVLGTAGGLLWGLLAAAGVLVFAAWLDLVWELAPALRIAMLGIAAASAVVLFGALVCQTVRHAGFTAMARRLDAAAQTSGEILTGWELDQALARQDVNLISRECSVTAELASMAGTRAEELARQASLSAAVPARPLGRALAAVVAVAAAIGVLALIVPDLIVTEWERFSSPLADVPPYSPLHFTVTPGDARVLYGEDLEITVKVDGGAADRVELVLLAADGRDSSLPMFAESGGVWRAVLSKLTEPATYFVRSYRARSKRFSIEIVTVPLIESIRVLVAPPEYAGQPNYEGPPPEEGVKGLRGARVTLWATSNRPLGGGKIIVSRSGAGAPKPRQVDMRPTEPDSQEAAGQFEIEGDGKFELRVIDAAGQPSQQAFCGNVTMIKDQHPIVRILKPPLQSLATPTAALPIIVSAEDDCGISRLEIFRSLDSSRPLPAAVRLPSKPPHRRDETISLPLAAYGLEPGDVLSFFARAEDNDPAGAKGAESPVVTVKIISQEEFERMLQVRQGVETLISKYRQAQRRMEGMAKQVEGLRSKLQKAPPDSRVAKELREEVGRLQRLMRREASELRKSAEHRLPFDLDGKLSPELGNLATMTDKMAEELEKLEKQLDLTSGDLEKKLKEMAKQLDARRASYAADTMMPLELLEAVFPLLVDQQRFIVVAMRQEDLAKRMAALKGHDGEDDPALKARMRDLEQEQRSIHTELDALLDDIDEHALRLPDRPELKKLRETAQKFAKDVRASGAAEALAESEAALADFAGTKALDKASEAARILMGFVKRCEGDGDMLAECRGALIFQPMLASGLGNTVAQLLAAMGFGQKMGGMGGRGMMGLYGDTAGMSGLGSGEFGNPHEGSSGRGDEASTQGIGGGDIKMAGAGEAEASGAAAAASEAGVPLRYRRAVRQYFQRLSDELGERLPARSAAPVRDSRKSSTQGVSP